jgi:hypothetical protein
MDEFAGRLVAKIGIDRAAAAKAAGVIWQFPHRATEQAQAFIARMPPADGVAHAAQTDSNSAGMFAALGDVIGAGSCMATEMGTARAVVCDTLQYACENAGTNAAGDTVGAGPGSGQFV